MKKVFAALLALTLAMALLTGCAAPGGADGSPSASPGGTDASPTQGGDAPSGGLFDPIPKDEIKVGVIHITDPAEGSGYTYAHDQGIVGMQKALGLDDSQIIRKNNVNDQDATAIENAMRECVEAGANIIFATSWGYRDICEALAKEFPDVVFSHGSGDKSNGTNFNNYFGRIYQARYLTGIAAGLKTETNKIGYVAAWGEDNAEVTGGLNAFAMGAYSVNPDCEVYVKTTNSWFDPEGEKQAAMALIDLGCDVIGQHCDTPNPQLAAEERGVFGVGYNSNMSSDAPDAVLTSTVWDWSAYYTFAVEAMISGTWTGENYFGGMAEGMVGYSPLSDLCEEGTQEKIDEAQAKIIDGSWDVFDGEIETNTGETIGAAGQRMSDEEITTGIHWYFKNVVKK
ncbi:MAG: BMP family ABC transporter substrate-binding protein [Christensenellales bacterium]|jgi:basic membrane protein A